METTLRLRSDENRPIVFGPRDKHLRLIRDTFGVRLSARDDEISIEGASEAIENTRLVLEELDQMADDGQRVTEREVRQVVDTVERSGQTPADLQIETFTTGRVVRPQTPGQLAYCGSVGRNDLTFCIGPAGTGKTYLAVAMAVQALKKGRIKRIVLVRPAVEAGEKLGYLPGDLQAKVNPYLRPLMDALHDMIGFKQVQSYMGTDVIEVIPLAYMRGRTLNDAWIILDEAQNSTTAQMKMFLTRMGMRSKMVVTGDVTQTDLAAGTRSGLVDAWEKLRGIDGIAFQQMTRKDIVRHRLVQEIVNAYERGMRGTEHRIIGRKESETSEDAADNESTSAESETSEGESPESGERSEPPGEPESES